MITQKVFFIRYFLVALYCIFFFISPINAHEKNDDRIELLLAKIDRLEQQYQELMDRVRTLENQQNQNNATKPDETGIWDPASIDSEKETKPTPNSNNNTAPGANTNTQTPVTPPNKEATQSTDIQAYYKKAYDLLMNGNIEKSRIAFNHIIQTYPTDPLISNAYYWLGESYYVTEDYKQSAGIFAKGYKTMPNGNKAHAMLLKLAYSLDHLGMKDRAKKAITKLLAVGKKLDPLLRTKAETLLKRL